MPLRGASGKVWAAALKSTDDSEVCCWRARKRKENEREGGGWLGLESMCTYAFVCGVCFELSAVCVW